MAEDEFRDVDFLLLVDLDGYAIAVVEDGDGVLLRVDGDLEGIHGGISLLVVCGVDEDLVEDLVEARDVGHGALHHLVILVDPQRLRVLLDGPHVGVRSEQDVLQLRLLLVDFFDGLPRCCGGHVGGAAALERALRLGLHDTEGVSRERKRNEENRKRVCVSKCFQSRERRF